MLENIKLIAQRIKELRKISELSQQDIAKDLNISVEKYKEYESGNIDIPVSFLYEIAGKFNVELTVLLTGEEPQKKAIVWCDDKGANRDFTFSEIKKYSNKTANFFKSLGIKKGDAVMLILKRRFEFWFAIIALHKIGAIPIPATHLLTEKDIVYRNNAADIKMIVAVSTDNVSQAVDKAESKSPTLKFKVAVNGNVDGWYNFEKEIEKQSDIFEKPTGADATKNDDKFLLYFTSGTTGMPKMVLHDFTYPLGHIITSTWQNIQENGLHLTVADTGWAKSAWGKLYGQWINGCTVFVYDYDKFIPKELLTVISKYGVTSFCAPPTIYRYFIKEDVTKFDLSKLKYCTIAGEPLNPEVYNQWKDLTDLRLMEAYGQTETVALLCNFPWMDPKPGSMGKPSPLYNIDIVDENYNSCEAGEVGQIAIRVADKKPLGMFCGYYRDESLTKKVWHDGIYFTGDTAYKDEDGHYWFVGRADDIIKSSGYRIGPFEVESALIEHPSVLECAITAVPDPDRGQIVKATIVLAKGYVASEELKKEIQNHVKKVTAPYKYPRIVEFVTELPKTISGKIRRVEIRDNDDK